MKLTYQTGTATILQLIVLGLLNIVDTISSIVTACTSNGSQCAPNILSSIIFYLLIIGYFALMAAFGYQAQTKRSKKYAKLLILSELALFLVAAYDVKLGIKYHNGAIGLFTSLIDMIISVWVMTLAYRLVKAGDSRVTRRRPHTKSDQSN